jgi:hypothetical protein
MVASAQQDQVGEGGLASVSPVLDVMGVAPSGRPPQATSATRAGGWARRRRSTSGIAGIHSVPSRLRKIARLNSARPSGSHDSGGGGAAGPEGVHQIRERPRGANDVDPLVGVVEEMIRIGEHGHVFGRHAVPARERLGRGIVHLEQAARRVLLEPFAHVALGGGGAPGELGRGDGFAVGERPIQPEPLPQVEGYSSSAPSVFARSRSASACVRSARGSMAGDVRRRPPAIAVRARPRARDPPVSGRSR